MRVLWTLTNCEPVSKLWALFASILFPFVIEQKRKKLSDREEKRKSYVIELKKRNTHTQWSLLLLCNVRFVSCVGGLVPEKSQQYSHHWTQYTFWLSNLYLCLLICKLRSFLTIHSNRAATTCRYCCSLCLSQTHTHTHTLSLSVGCVSPSIVMLNFHLCSNTGTRQWNSKSSIFRTVLLVIIRHCIVCMQLCTCVCVCAQQQQLLSFVSIQAKISFHPIAPTLHPHQLLTHFWQPTTTATTIGREVTWTFHQPTLVVCVARFIVLYVVFSHSLIRPSCLHTQRERDTVGTSLTSSSYNATTSILSVFLFSLIRLLLFFWWSRHSHLFETHKNAQ